MIQVPAVGECFPLAGEGICIACLLGYDYLIAGADTPGLVILKQLVCHHIKK